MRCHKINVKKKEAIPSGSDNDESYKARGNMYLLKQTLNCKTGGNKIFFYIIISVNHKQSQIIKAKSW